MLTWVCAAWWECCWGGWLRVSAPAACCVVYWRGVQYEWFLLLRILFLTAANLSDLWQYSFTSAIPPFLTFISPMIHYLVCETHTAAPYVVWYCGRTLCRGVMCGTSEGLKDGSAHMWEIWGCRHKHSGHWAANNVN